MIRWTLLAYCSDCGYDLTESDSDDLDSLTFSLEARAETLLEEHLLSSNCEG